MHVELNLSACQGSKVLWLLTSQDRKDKGKCDFWCAGRSTAHHRLLLQIGLMTPGAPYYGLPLCLIRTCALTIKNGGILINDGLVPST